LDIEIELLPLVDMDGVLTETERKRILKRLHTILSWVGSQIPKEQKILGEQVNLRQLVLELISKRSLSKDDIVGAKMLAQILEEREMDLEREITDGDISEDEALLLLEEARGLLRAIVELRTIDDPKRKTNAKDLILAKVDDEKRWQYFMHKLKK
jgi:hypothetical protein